jgi:hypothetical protein
MCHARGAYAQLVEGVRGAGCRSEDEAEEMDAEEKRDADALLIDEPCR